MLLSFSSITAFAVEEEPPADDPIPVDEYTRNVYSDIWTLCYSGTGSAVRIYVHNNTMFKLDIQMLDYSNNQVWYHYTSIQEYGTGNYYVGSNVAKVRVRCSDGIGSGTVTVTVTTP